MTNAIPVFVVLAAAIALGLVLAVVWPAPKSRDQFGRTCLLNQRQVSERSCDGSPTEQVETRLTVLAGPLSQTDDAGLFVFPKTATRARSRTETSRT